MLDRHTEDAQRGVALELVDEAAVLLDGVDDDIEEFVQHLDDLARPPGDRKLGRAHQVDEQHRDVALLATEFGTAFQRSPRHVLADVPAKEVAQSLAFAEFADHVVEARLQQAQLAGVVDLHVRVVVSALHFAQRPPQLPQRVGDRHGGQDVGGQSDRQGGQCHQQDGGEVAVGGSPQQGELVGDDGQHDHQQRHTGGQHPGQDKPQHHAAAAEILRNPAAQCLDGNGPQHPFGLQVADDGRCGGTEQRRHCDDRRRPAGDRPTHDDENNRPEQPVGDRDR